MPHSILFLGQQFYSLMHNSVTSRMIESLDKPVSIQVRTGIFITMEKYWKGGFADFNYVDLTM